MSRLTGAARSGRRPMIVTESLNTWSKSLRAHVAFAKPLRIEREVSSTSNVAHVVAQTFINYTAKRPWSEGFELSHWNNQSVNQVIPH